MQLRQLSGAERVPSRRARETTCRDPNIRNGHKWTSTLDAKLNLSAAAAPAAATPAVAASNNNATSTAEAPCRGSSPLLWPSACAASPDYSFSRRGSCGRFWVAVPPALGTGALSLPPVRRDAASRPAGEAPSIASSPCTPFRMRGAESGRTALARSSAPAPSPRSTPARLAAVSSRTEPSGSPSAPETAPRWAAGAGGPLRHDADPPPSATVEQTHPVEPASSLRMPPHERRRPSDPLRPDPSALRRPQRGRRGAGCGGGDGPLAGSRPLRGGGGGDPPPSPPSPRLGRAPVSTRPSPSRPRADPARTPGSRILSVRTPF